jgi:hypothetical protein
MMPLKGKQLSMLPDVTPYWIENLPRPGEQITTRAGTATVTRLELMGEEVIFWADYGSRIEHPHGRERATCDLKIVLGGSAVCQIPLADTNLKLDFLEGAIAEEPVVVLAESSSEKTVLGAGADTLLETADSLVPKLESKACGWIGWKTSKRERKRRDPWIGRQAWLYWEEPGGKKRSRYIPKAKLEAVERSVYGLRRPVSETLELLNS